MILASAPEKREPTGPHPVASVTDFGYGMIKTIWIAAIVSLKLGLCGVLLAQTTAYPAEKAPFFFEPGTLTFSAVLPPPPTPDTEAGRRDQDELIRIERARTQAEIHAAQEDDQGEDIF